MCNDNDDDQSNDDDAYAFLNKAEKILQKVSQQQSNNGVEAGSGVVEGKDDAFSEMLAQMDYSDFKDQIIDEQTMIEAFPTASSSRIKLERKF